MKQQQDLKRKAPHSLEDSPLGPLATDSAQSLLANLSGVLAQLFPDYDFSGITPDDFEKCDDKYAVVNSINHQLAVVVDRVRSGFLADFWRVIKDAIDMSQCEIYALRPNTNVVPAEGSLWSIHYFFFDCHRARILFLRCVTMTRQSGGGSEESEGGESLDFSSQASSRELSDSMEGSMSAQDQDISEDDMMHD